jgi:phage terminase large subunit
MLNPNLRAFWEKLDIIFRTLAGGRMSGKTHDAAGMAILTADCFEVRFLCLRQFQSKIADSVHTVLKHKIVEQKLMHRFVVTDTTIRNTYTGSEFLFYGIARNLNEVKGMEGIDITWIEEAEGLTAKQWEILEPTLLRKAGSEVWIVFNPQFQQDFAYQYFVVNPPAKSIVRLINYDENPFLSEQALTIIAEAKERDPELFENVYLGVPKVDSEGVIIRRSWLQACVDAHIKLGIVPTDNRRLGFDVADGGPKSDLCALVEMTGSLVSWCSEWRGTEDGLLRSCRQAYYEAQTRNAELVYDVCGMGVGAGSKFAELNEINPHNRVEYIAYNAGGGVRRPDARNEIDPTNKKKNKDLFLNVKAQDWALLAQRARNTYEAINLGRTYDEADMLFFDSKMPHLEKLLTELSTPKQDTDNTGKLKVESKKDLDKREIPSPNLADACIMAATHIRKASWWTDS